MAITPAVCPRKNNDIFLFIYSFRLAKYAYASTNGNITNGVCIPLSTDYCFAHFPNSPQHDFPLVIGPIATFANQVINSTIKTDVKF